MLQSTVVRVWVHDQHILFIYLFLFSISLRITLNHLFHFSFFILLMIIFNEWFSTLYVVLYCFSCFYSSSTWTIIQIIWQVHFESHVLYALLMFDVFPCEWISFVFEFHLDSSNSFSFESDCFMFVRIAKHSHELLPPFVLILNLNTYFLSPSFFPLCCSIEFLVCHVTVCFCFYQIHSFSFFINFLRSTLFLTTNSAPFKLENL